MSHCGGCRRKGSVAAMLDRKNAGVGERDQRDRLALKVRPACLPCSLPALLWVFLFCN